jgi:type IV pilus assembly protein PilW
MKMYFLRKQYLHSSTRGFSLVELLVVMTLGLMLTGMILSSTILHNRTFRKDLVRTRIEQNLRGAFEIIGTQIRQAGERLPGSFPAIELVDNGSSGSDVLTLRRSLLDGLTVCRDITAGSTLLQVYLNNTVSGAPPACTTTGQSSVLTTYTTYREEYGEPPPAYIWNLSAKQGELFYYSSETNSGNNVWLTRQNGFWANAYPALGAMVFVIDEWKFQRSTASGETDIIEVIQNNDTANKQKLVFGITDFQIVLNMKDGTTKTSYTQSEDWTLIKSIAITLTAQDTYRGTPITRSLSAEFFPRNILSS